MPHIRFRELLVIADPLSSRHIIHLLLRENEILSNVGHLRYNLREKFAYIWATLPFPYSLRTLSRHDPPRSGSSLTHYVYQYVIPALDKRSSHVIRILQTKVREDRNLYYF